MAKEGTLEAMTQAWMSMERKTLKQREKAELFYEKNLMQLVIDSYLERNKDLVFEKVEFLILSVGTSYEPLLLNISLLKPEQILFLYTSDSESIINKVVEFLHLSASRYEKQLVDATGSLSVYQKIKEAYLTWGRPQRIYIDFTGGTKTMSAAAALAGTLIDVQMIYVGTENYLQDFHKPMPGSEELFYIDNPIEVFGDFELEKIFTLIGRYNYSAAAEKLQKLKDNIPDPTTRQQIDFVYLLVKAYEFWDALEFQKAKSTMEELLAELKRDYRLHKNFLMMDFQETLNDQFRVLCRLDQMSDLLKQKKQQVILENRAMMAALMHTLYSNALRREGQGKYDMSTLLFYRLLEMIVQRRLIIYRIYASKPDYSQIDFSKIPAYANLSAEEQLEKLKIETEKIRTNLFHGPGRDYLPSPVALMDGCILLAALEDPVITDKNGKTLSLLQRIRTMVSLRNNSIFAHGLGPVPQEDYIKFRDFVTELFKNFCIVEKINFSKYKEICTFLNPINSNFYQIIGGES